ncbi:hypothetical protein C8R43DRAFT_1139025 [Mycena crocata]|nr:hypothetical protein C8R43DRAFT_1139025 [Mycena crocata]
MAEPIPPRRSTRHKTSGAAATPAAAPLPSRKKKPVDEGKESNTTDAPKPPAVRKTKGKKGGNPATESALIVPPVDGAPQEPPRNLEAPLTLDARKETSTVDAVPDAPIQLSNADAAKEPCSFKENTSEREDASDEYVPEELSALDALHKGQPYPGDELLGLDVMDCRFALRVVQGDDCRVMDDFANTMRINLLNTDLFNPNFDIGAWHRWELEQELAEKSPRSAFPLFFAEHKDGDVDMDPLQLDDDPGTKKKKKLVRDATPGPDEQKDWETRSDASDASDYAATAALKTKARKEHNKVARQIPGATVQLSMEEQDRLDDAEFGAGEGGRGKDKGKGKSKAWDEEEEEEEEEDEQDDDEESQTAPWELRKGAISKEGMKDLLEAHAFYHQRAESIARREGKLLSSVFKAAGDHQLVERSANAWNAHQSLYRQDHPRPKTMSVEDYALEVKTAYDNLFSALWEEEMADPAARRECTKELMQRFHERNEMVLDNRRARGRGKALMDKTLQPFIHQATITSQKYDIDVIGMAIDVFGDCCAWFTGSDNGRAVLDAYGPTFNHTLVQFKAMTQVTATARAKEAEAVGDDEGGIRKQPPPIPIAFKKKDTRDERRVLVSKMMLNRILIELRDRSVDASSLKTMAWKKWPDTAMTYHLRIINWPVDLKQNCPCAEFNSSWAGKHAEAFTKLYENLRENYESGVEATGTTTIVSWTEEEMDLDPEDQLDIPLVVCVDSSTLVTGRDSRALLRSIEKAKKAKKAESKSKSKSKAAKHGATKLSSDEEDDDNDVEHQRPASKRQKSSAGSTSTLTPGLGTTSALGQSSVVAGPSSSFLCRYQVGNNHSDSFTAARLILRKETTPKSQREAHTYYWQSAVPAWVMVPERMEIVGEDTGMADLCASQVGLL